MRSVAARWSGADHRVHRVVTGERLSGEWTPDLRFVVLANDETELSKASRLNVSHIGTIPMSFLLLSRMFSFWAEQREIMVAAVATGMKWSVITGGLKVKKGKLEIA